MTATATTAVKKQITIRKQITLENYNELGSLLRYIRVQQDMKVKKLADDIGRTPKQLHKYETDQVAIPSDVLVRWLAALGYNLAITQ